MTLRPQFLVLLIVICFVTVLGLQFNVYHYAETQNLAAAANLTSFSGALAWVVAGGYVLMFVGMMIEGPVVTAAAAFAAALGYFNIWIVFIFAIMGDLAADMVYYGIGYFGRVAFVEKYGHHIGITKQHMERLEHLIHTHPKKTMVAVKLAPMLPVPGLMMIGATRMSFKRFSTMAFVITLPKVLIFMALGYYFGRAYDSISHYIENGQYFIVIALVVIVAAFYIYKKVTARISLQLEAI
jgi:membrane-associated protein